MPIESSQLDHWRGSFGNGYVDRNMPSEDVLRSRTRLWSEILLAMGSECPSSILEVGANVGTNLRALRALTDAAYFAIEPNDRARTILANDGVVKPENLRGGSAKLIGFENGIADLVFTSGVLIHIPPADLEESCREMYRCAKRFVVCIEYFSDNPVTIPYRGEADLLFKRDFGALWLDLFPNLVVVKTGFAWKRTTGLDNLTWWVFRK